MRHSNPPRRAGAFALVVAGALATTACAVGPTPYQPATAGSQIRGGYSDQQIEANRFSVTFAGNSYTSRETVERYLLYRAAQLTVERGFDHFILVDRNTDKQTRTYVDRPFGGYAGFGYWSPHWRYYGGGFGWRSWDPFWGDPFFDRTMDVRTIDRYEATAEILVGRGPKPDNVRAFDARSVLQNLGPTVAPPAPTR
jgi:hypothetical protein